MVVIRLPKKFPLNGVAYMRTCGLLRNTRVSSLAYLISNSLRDTTYLNCQFPISRPPPFRVRLSVFFTKFAIDDPWPLPITILVVVLPPSLVQIWRYKTTESCTVPMAGIKSQMLQLLALD